jgi:hypothetical protein
MLNKAIKNSISTQINRKERGANLKKDVKTLATRG